MIDLTGVRAPFRTQMRDAAESLLRAYKADAGIKLQVYRARPASITPPTAFIDRITEDINGETLLRERVVRCEIVVLHGTFDSGSAVDQGDKFVDGFINWVGDRYHAAGTNSIVQTVSIDDDPFYTAEWVPPGERDRDFYASRITLEGNTRS